MQDWRNVRKFSPPFEELTCGSNLGNCLCRQVYYPTCVFNAWSARLPTAILLKIDLCQEGPWIYSNTLQHNSERQRPAGQPEAIF